MTNAIRDFPYKDLAFERAHFSNAPSAFFHAWKQAVSLAGLHLFGAGKRADLDRAVSVWDLRPKVDDIDHSIGVMSSGEKVFLAALVSFYNAEDGGRLFERVGIRGLADLGGLDLRRRTIIAALILNYNGW